MSVHPKDLSEMTIAELLDWHDEHRIKACERHIDRMRELIGKLGKRADHASNFARETFRAEIARVEAALAAPPLIEAERVELAKAHAAWCEHARKPLPTDVDGELRRLAERNVLDRARVAAYQKFIAAAQRSVVRAHLPELGHTWVTACRESSDLASKANDLTDRYWGQGYANKAIDLAALQGKSFTGEALGAALFAVAAAERETSDETRALFGVRWFYIARKLGLEGAKLPDLSRWERAA